MKILFVTAEPHPTFRADVRVLFGKYLPRHGIQSDLLAQSLPGKSSVPWSGGRTWLVPRVGNALRRIWLQWRHDLRLFALARQGYDAIQVRDRVLCGAIGLLAARRARIPFFYWASYPKPEARLLATRIEGVRHARLAWCLNQVRGRLAAALLYRWVMPHADHVFVQSEAMRASLVSRGVAEERMTAVPMGVDLEALSEKIEPSEEWKRRLAGRDVVVYVGALEKTRRPTLMLDVMELVRRQLPNAVLLLIGGSVYEQDMVELRARVEELGLHDHVLMTGWVSPAEALGFVSLGRVGLSVIPRGKLYDVSSPTKIAEYFALGLPVVANDLPDQVHVLNECQAGICVNEDPLIISGAIQKLLGDKDSAASMGKSGQDYVRLRRSYSSIASSLADSYRGLLRTKDGGRK